LNGAERTGKYLGKTGGSAAGANVFPGAQHRLVRSMAADALQHHRLGQISAAEAIYRKILEIDGNHADSLHLLGVAAHQQGRDAEAIELIRRAILTHPAGASYHLNLGNVLRSMGHLEDAIQAYRRSAALAPNSFEVYVNLGNVLRMKGLVAEAIDSYKHSLALREDNPEAYNNLGNAYRGEGREKEAETCYRRAVTLNPAHAAAHHNLGNLLMEQGDLEQALREFETTLKIAPDYPYAIFSQGLAELKKGEFSSGWQKFEQRWNTESHDTPRRHYQQPMWTGEKLSAGKLFLWGEQGIGDEIMFAGLIPEVLRTGNRCIVECDARLQPMFSRSFPEAEVVARGASGEPPAFDVHLPSGSLPGLLRNSETSFARGTSPYLFADKAQHAQFRSRYSDGGKVVGLAWHTRNKTTGRRRSISLPAFAPLFARHDIRWVSLQYGDHADLETQAQHAAAPLCVDREVDQLQDMDSFAAQISAMDLVITIDNSTAHLAGALGVPVWLLLPHTSDWRWQVDRPDSPWYPTLRLFRQPRPNDWPSVIAQLCDML
jgi:tetratricopeptide (TPR) repeat protein